MARAVRIPHPVELQIFRGTPGYIRVGRTRLGQWWFVGPAGNPCLCRGVNGVGQSDDAVRPAAEIDAQLRRWHCNTLGPGSTASSPGRNWWHTHTVGFCSAFLDTVIRAGGACLPDVFDPRWVAACDARAAEVCGPRALSDLLLGYFTDEDLRWQQGTASGGSRVPRPTLLQLCLGLEPSYAAYHAAWEFVLAAHGREWARLARDWEIKLPNKEALRQMTLEERPVTGPGYERDHARFSREFARRYFTATSAAIRRHDPNHLVLGCQFAAHPGEAVLLECAAPNVDVVSARVAQPDAAALLENYHRPARMPVLASEFSWAGEEFRRAAPGAAGRGRTSVERMLARGRSALRSVFSHPALVGYLWEQYIDGADDDAPFGRGLVRRTGREAGEHTELWTLLNSESEARRRRGVNADAARPLTVLGVR